MRSQDRDFPIRSNSAPLLSRTGPFFYPGGFRLTRAGTPRAPDGHVALGCRARSAAPAARLRLGRRIRGRIAAPCDGKELRPLPVYRDDARPHAAIGNADGEDEAAPHCLRRVNQAGPIPHVGRCAVLEEALSRAHESRLLDPGRWLIGLDGRDPKASMRKGTRRTPLLPCDP